MKRILTLFMCAAALALFSAGAVFGTSVPQKLLLSIDQSNNTLGGQAFKDDDILQYDIASDTGKIYFNGTSMLQDIVGNDEDINAIHRYADGKLVLSTKHNTSIAGVSFDDKDLVQYDPFTNTALKIFDGASMLSAHSVNGSSDTDIDAAYVRSNGNIIFSTAKDQRMLGMDFLRGDLVEYNPFLSTASIFFDSSTYMSIGTASTINIDGFHLLSNGNYLLSTSSSGTGIGGLTGLSDADIVEYNPSSNLASIYFAGSTFLPNASGDEDINAISVVPEPISSTLFLIGGATLGFRRFRSKFMK